MRPSFVIWPLVCALLAAPTAHAGDNGEGKIILAMSEAPETGYFYDFQFRSLDGKYDDHTSYAPYIPLFGDHSDFDNPDEIGAIRILTLPAGEWEIYTFTLGIVNLTFTPKKELSIRFTINPGESVYIGDYKLVKTGIQNGRDFRPTGGYFVVGDRSTRDIAIATKKDRSIGSVSVAVPDIESMHNPLFLPEYPSPPTTNTRPVKSTAPI